MTEEKKTISRRELRRKVGGSRSGRKQGTRAKKFRGKPGRSGVQSAAAKLKILIAKYRRDGYEIT